MTIFRSLQQDLAIKELLCRDAYLNLLEDLQMSSCRTKEGSAFYVSAFLTFQLGLLRVVLTMRITVGRKVG